MKEIPLTRGYVAYVDDEDYERLSAFKWHLSGPMADGKIYAARHLAKVNGKTRTIMMHREILGLQHGDKRRGDHKDPTQTLLNTRDNLRIATASQNLYNKRPGKSKSGLKGAFWAKREKKWESKIRYEGKILYLGLYATAYEAHLAYCYAAAHYHGEFARFE